MLDPVALFEFAPHVDQRTVRAQTLVVTLGSRDPGHSRQIISQHLLNTLPNHRLGGVDVDQVVDYASLRPMIGFERDHFHSYRPPAIDLHLVTDGLDQEFLLLSGPEPSFQWERMVGTVEYLIDQFDIQQTVIMQSVPAPAPHTRPLHISGYAGGPGVVPTEDALPVAFEMGATFTSLLTLRLGERDHEVSGLVAHVPHYLAAAEVPEAAVALLDRLAKHTGLDVPTTALTVAAQAMRPQIDAEVADSQEAQQMVAQLEQQYDHFVQQRGLTAGNDVPTADEIGAQVEDFLRDLAMDDDVDAPVEDNPVEDETPEQ